MSRLADLTRPLRRRPGLTLLAALLLALGIGANGAIFSAVHAILLAPLPFAAPERLVVLWKAQPALDGALVEVSYPEFREWQRQSRSFAGLGAVGASPLTLTLTGREKPEKLTGAVVSGELLALLGVRPAEGRLLAPADDQMGTERMIVLSDGLRRRLFGPSEIGGRAGRPAVGQRLTLSGKSYTVAGVLPPRFDYPPRAEFWAPVAAAFPDIVNERGTGFLRVVGRLRGGVDAERARLEMDQTVRRVAQTFGVSGPEQKSVVLPLREFLLGDTREGLWLLFGLVGLILLIACADVASLLLAQAAGRRTELAIRSSLGAGRGPLVRQLVLESVPAAVLGGLGGLALTALGIRLLTAFGPADLPRLAEVRLSPLVLGFTALLSLAALLLFATLPAVQTARRIDLKEILGEGSRGAMSSRQSRRWMSLLLAVQTGMAVFLVIAAALLVSRFRGLQQVELGFRPERILTAEIPMPDDKATPEAQIFWRTLLARLRSLPGATSAAAVLLRPLEGDIGWDLTYTAEGQTKEEHLANPNASFETATPDYFETMGIPLVAGRAFTEEDRADGLPVAIVSESLARRHWPKGDAVGKRIKDFAPDSKYPWITIVGVAGDVRYRGLAIAPPLDYYVPYTQSPYAPLHVVVRTEGDPLALAAALEREVWALDRNLPVAGITTMEARLATVLAQPRLLASLSGLFSVLAALLAAIGLYGVVSTSVQRRTREIGLRMALGSSRARVLRLVAREGLAPAALGAAGGLLVAFWLRGVVEGWLAGSARADAAVFTAFALLLMAAAGLAVYLPARRAMRLDPGLSLREE
jgi:putative ABC transport system permease protein